MEELDDLLEALHAAGPQDSTGRFTVSGQHALAKLRRFQFREQHHYALPLYSSAVAAGATRVRVAIGKRSFSLERNGPPLLRGELERLLDVLLNGGPPAAYELALGVNGALALPVNPLAPLQTGTRVVILTGDLQATWFIEGDQVRCQVVPHTGPSFQGVRVLVGPRVLETGELEALRERAGHAPPALEMPQPPRLPWNQPLAVRELHSPDAPLPPLDAPLVSRAPGSEGFSLQLALFRNPVSPCVVWTRLGVTLRAASLPWNHVAVRIADPQLHRDASLADLVVDERFRSVERAMFRELDALLEDLQARGLGQAELLAFGPVCAELLGPEETRPFVLENRALADDSPAVSYWVTRAERRERRERLRADLGLHCLRDWQRHHSDVLRLQLFEEAALGSPRYEGALALLSNRLRPGLERGLEALFKAREGRFSEVSELLESPVGRLELLLAADAALARERWDSARQLYARVKGRSGLLGEAQVARRLRRFGEVEGRLTRERDTALTGYLLKSPVPAAQAEAEFREVVERHPPGSSWRAAARDFLVTCLLKAGRYQAAGMVLAEGRWEEEIMHRLGSLGDGHEFGPDD